LLVHLAEVDARGLYRERAYSSMFTYCVQALQMSEAEAYLRIGAARLGRQFPRIWPMLERGELHLSGLKLLAPVLDVYNADDLLEAARGKSKRALELLLAQRKAEQRSPTSERSKWPGKPSVFLLLSSLLPFFPLHFLFYSLPACRALASFSVGSTG
jgi:hypothetical protein